MNYFILLPTLILESTTSVCGYHILPNIIGGEVKFVQMASHGLPLSFNPSKEDMIRYTIIIITHFKDKKRSIQNLLSACGASAFKTL